MKSRGLLILLIFSSPYIMHEAVLSKWKAYSCPYNFQSYLWEAPVFKISDKYVFAILRELPSKTCHMMQPYSFNSMINYIQLLSIPGPVRN